MLDPFFLALLEDRMCLIHFPNESVESSFKDVYNSPLHICCLCLFDVVVASFKQSYLVFGKEGFRDLDGWSCFGPFAIFIHIWDDSHVGHQSVTIGIFSFPFPEEDAEAPSLMGIPSLSRRRFPR